MYEKRIEISQYLKIVMQQIGDYTTIFCNIFLGRCCNRANILATFWKESNEKWLHNQKSRKTLQKLCKKKNSQHFTPDFTKTYILKA
jgi:hypothetical protein